MPPTLFPEIFWLIVDQVWLNYQESPPDDAKEWWNTLKSLRFVSLDVQFMASSYLFRRTDALLNNLRPYLWQHLKTMVLRGTKTKWIETENHCFFKVARQVNLKVVRFNFLHNENIFTPQIVNHLNTLNLDTLIFDRLPGFDTNVSITTRRLVFHECNLDEHTITRILNNCTFKTLEFDPARTITPALIDYCSNIAHLHLNCSVTVSHRYDIIKSIMKHKFPLLKSVTLSFADDDDRTVQQLYDWLCNSDSLQNLVFYHTNALIIQRGLPRSIKSLKMVGYIISPSTRPDVLVSKLIPIVKKVPKRSINVDVVGVDVQGNVSHVPCSLNQLSNWWPKPA